MESLLIAPCGMNCGVCSAYIAKKLDLKKRGINRAYCVGCRPRGQNCTFMSNACEKLGKGLVKYCFECDTFPCARLKRLDKRYRTKYNLSMIENLTMIKEQGVKAFLKKEEEKWKCPECGGVICCHTGVCYSCMPQKPKSTWKKIPADKVTEADLIAPCGMNCGVCSSYLAMKNDVKSKGIKAAYCHGCLPRGKGCSMNKSNGCQKLMTLGVRFCYECEKFPCQANMHWDKVYREKYNTSPVENLKYIKAHGMGKFLEQQKEKWRCPECGGVMSCHNGVCYTCGLEKLKK
jgi:hypothetical protein